MQTLRATHLAQRPNSLSTTMAVEYEPITSAIYRPPLPRGAQQPQIRPRSDLPFDAPKRKNVLRKTSKSSSSTTVTTIASSASSSNHNANIAPFHVYNDHNSPPIEPGCDPLLDRLRYDLNFPPQQKPLPPTPVAGPEVQFGTDNNTHDTHDIQASWSDSGHLTRQNTLSALFISPSSSLSSSEAGHHDAVYHHPRSHAHPSSHPHVHQHPHPHPNPQSMPLAYHLPSRRMHTGRPGSTIQLNSDLESSVSHSHSTDTNLNRKPSLSWWKRSLGLLSDKRHKEDTHSQLSRATSLSVSTEPRPQARRIRNENGIIALSSATSESGHGHGSMSPTTTVVDFPSRAQRKLKKRPPSAWNPTKARSQSVNSFHPVQPFAVTRSTTVNVSTVNRQHYYSNSAMPLSVHSSLAHHRSRQPDTPRHRHTVYDDTGRRGHEYEYMTRERSSHVNPNLQYQHQPTFAANGQLLLNAEPLQYTPAPLNNTPVGFPIKNDDRGMSPYRMLPPLPSVSPLRIHIPFNPTPPPNATLSESARCRSEPDLTTKTSGNQSRGLTSTSTTYLTPNGIGSKSEAQIQSPIISSPSAYSSTSYEEQISPQVSSSYPVSSDKRPSFLRSPSNRRWTLAVSETPENELVEELERLRKIGWALGFQGELVKVKGEEAVEDADLDIEVMPGTSENTTGRRQVLSPSSGSMPSHVKWRKEEMEQWLIARKALLVCREIVRTEKTYHEGLETLQRGATLNPPPPLLLQYLPALISASHTFSERLAEDPSAWGVSAAFIGCEEVLEAAFVAWSGVVGEFFGAKSNSRRNTKHDTRRLGIAPSKGRTGRRISLGFERIPLVQSSSSTQRAAEGSKAERQPEKKSSHAGSTRLNRNATTSFSNLQAALWRRSTPGLSFLLGQSDASATGPETNGSNTRSLFGALSSSPQDTTSFFPASSSRKSRHFPLKFGNGGSGENVANAHGNHSASGVKVPTVQDLAIQPVQRVVRYVLLYKDLFNSTPETSPSRALVGRALEGASRIAQRCNRAQDNAAFLL